MYDGVSIKESGNSFTTWSIVLGNALVPAPDLVLYCEPGTTAVYLLSGMSFT